MLSGLGQADLDRQATSHASHVTWTGELGQSSHAVKPIAALDAGNGRRPILLPSDVIAICAKELP